MLRAKWAYVGASAFALAACCAGHEPPQVRPAPPPVPCPAHVTLTGLGDGHGCGLDTSRVRVGGKRLARLGGDYWIARWEDGAETPCHIDTGVRPSGSISPPATFFGRPGPRLGAPRSSSRLAARTAPRMLATKSSTRASRFERKVIAGDHSPARAAGTRFRPTP